MPGLKVAALISGEPGPHELWTLRRMASADCELSVVQATGSAALPPLQRARSLIKRHGALGTVSRFVGGAVGSRMAAEDGALLEELFDFDELRVWWGASGLVPAKVRALNHAEAQATLAALSPDLIVRVTGGILKPQIVSLARIAALNIHHGQAPLIRGMWSIPWGIVEGRRDWIGATIHVIDDGIDTGPILWRGGPQLAPGDTHVDLFFRAHLEAADALARILKSYARGDAPQAWTPGAGQDSTYRSSAGLGAWIKLLYLDRGRRARVLLERGVEC
ncbi:MAG: formyltransferase family protein [Elusimicrobiota bacterium]